MKRDKLANAVRRAFTRTLEKQRYIDLHSMDYGTDVEFKETLDNLTNFLLEELAEYKILTPDQIEQLKKGAVFDSRLRPGDGMMGG